MGATDKETEPDVTNESASPEAPLPDHGQPSTPAESPGEEGGVAASLHDYARRLAGAGDQPLGDAVSVYADRVDKVERGELPPSMSVAPPAIAPEMIGAALSQSRLEPVIEVIRNTLIFGPVLWTWLKLQRAVTAYPDDRDDYASFFDFWVDNGGRDLIGGGPLGEAAQEVAFILVALIALNAFLGLWRRRTAARGARVGRGFASVLARAEAVGSGRRSSDPQAALDGFVHASNELTVNLRSVGESLERSVNPFADSVSVAQDTLREMSDAVTRQERRLAEVVERLGRVAEIGDQLGALQRDFAEAREAASRSAEALAGIRESLDPSARDFAGAAATLEQLAGQLERMTEVMAGEITGWASGLDSSAGKLNEAAISMNAVATRVLDDLDGRGSPGDGR